MSSRDSRDGAYLMQAKSSISPLERWEKIGFVCTADIVSLFGVSDGVVRGWVRNGLQAFTPGTEQTMFRRQDVESFLTQRKTFNQTEGKRRNDSKAGTR